MSTSVILIAYHGDRWLPACLESLTQGSERELHLVLVDNAGNTIIKDLDLSGYDVDLLDTPRPMGFAEANNFALVAASRLEDRVLFLNQDTISPPGWIDSCAMALQHHRDLGAVSPLIRTYNDDGWDPSFMGCLTTEQKTAVKNEALDREVLYTQNAPAPALMVRTEVLRAAGPFDPVFGSYYEDYDLCRRIRAMGFKIGFCSQARIQHFAGGSTKTEAQERRRMRQVIRNRVLYQLREKDDTRWLAALRWMFADFPRRLARGLVGTPSSQPPSVTLRAYADLLKIGPRLVSESYDKAQWARYLNEIGWSSETSDPTTVRPPTQQGAHSSTRREVT